MPKLFALADGNNFFVSCERVFNPALKGLPVVVLSNNDGCVVARSNEAKAIGVAMGEPYFKCRSLLERHQGQVYSANFVLYGDMSARLMQSLAFFTPELEVYSIDEAFLSLEGLTVDPQVYAKQIRAQVARDIGMPVSIGVAPTKTLAKVANRIAKKHVPDGVFYLTPDVMDHWLERIAVEDVWGIGHQKAQFLKSYGILNARQLAQAEDVWIKKNLSIVTLKTVWELRGIACLPLDEVLPDKKGISTSRTFGQEVRGFAELAEAVAAYTARAAEKLRAQDSLCGYLQVYVETDRFKGGKFYANSAGIDLTPPTAYSPDLIQKSGQLLAQIYKPGYAYKKAGVLLSKFQPAGFEQGYLFDPPYTQSPKQRLMDVIDRYNQATNHAKIFLASEGAGQPWHMKQSHKSRRFTTRWDELLEIRI